MRLYPFYLFLSLYITRTQPIMNSLYNTLKQKLDYTSDTGLAHRKDDKNVGHAIYIERGSGRMGVLINVERMLDSINDWMDE